MTEKIICEKCGNEMENHSYNDSIHIECPNCGWGWATTTYDQSLDDTTAYEIWILPGNAHSAEILKTIAKIAHINILQAKKLLNKSEPTKLYPYSNYPCNTLNRIHEIKEFARILQTRNIQFYISPSFPYKY